VSEDSREVDEDSHDRSRCGRAQRRAGHDRPADGLPACPQWNVSTGAAAVRGEALGRWRLLVGVARPTEFIQAIEHRNWRDRIHPSCSRHVAEIAAGGARRRGGSGVGHVCAGACSPRVSRGGRGPAGRARSWRGPAQRGDPEAVMRRTRCVRNVVAAFARPSAPVSVDGLRQRIGCCAAHRLRRRRGEIDRGFVAAMKDSPRQPPCFQAGHRGLARQLDCGWGRRCGATRRKTCLMGSACTRGRATFRHAGWNRGGHRDHPGHGARASLPLAALLPRDLIPGPRHERGHGARSTPGSPSGVASPSRGDAPLGPGTGWSVGCVAGRRQWRPSMKLEVS